MEEEEISTNKNSIINDNKFKIQNADDDTELNKIVFRLSNLASSQDVQHAKGLKSKVVRRVIAKFKQNNYICSEKELKKLKDALYTEDDELLEDQQEEEYFSMYKDEDKNNTSTKKLHKDARYTARVGVIQSILDSLEEIAKNKEMTEKVRKFAKSLKPKTIKVGEKSVKFNPSMATKLINDWQKDIEENPVPNLKEEEGKIENNEIKNDDENEFKERKKKLADIFKKKRQDKFKNIYNIIDETKGLMERTNENIKKMMNGDKILHNKKFGDDNKKASWQDLVNSSLFNIQELLGYYLQEGVNGCGNKDFNDAKSLFVLIGATFMACYQRIKNLEEITKEMMQVINALNKEKSEMAKFGPNSMMKINQKINSINKKGRKYVNTSDWDKLTEFERFEKTFQFSDFVQNVPRGWYKKFSTEQKLEFIKKRQVWRKNRLITLAEQYQSDNDKYIKYIDTFLFYWDKDKYGLTIDTTSLEKENNIVLDNKEQEIFNGLQNELNDASRKGLVFNKVLVQGKYIYGNGLSTKDKLAKLQKKNNNNGYNNNNLWYNHMNKYRSNHNFQNRWRFLKNKRNRYKGSELKEIKESNKVIDEYESNEEMNINEENNDQINKNDIKKKNF